MSGGGGIIIICGSSNPFTDKQIWVYDSMVSVAIKLDKQALEDAAVAAGMDREKAIKRVNRLAAMLEADWENWADFIEDKLGVGYTRHEAHPANFP